MQDRFLDDTLIYYYDLGQKNQGGNIYQVFSTI